MGKRWTQKETDTLREMYQTSHIDTICETLNRTRYQVYERARRINLKRPDEWRIQMCPYPKSTATQFKKGHKAWNKGMKLGSDFGGKQTQFKKGHPTWNKGMKLGSDFGGKETQFKKGQVPHNKLPEDLREITKQLSRLKKNIKTRERYAER